MFPGFLDSLPTAASVLGPDFRIQRVNTAIQRWMKLGAAEMEGQHCYKLFHHRESICEDCPVAIAFESGKVAHAEHTGLDGSGATTYASLVAFPIRDEQGQIRAVLEQVTDTTVATRVEKERAQLMADLAASEERYRRVLEDSSDAIWLLDRSGHTAWVNQRTTRLSGKSAEEWLGMPFFDWLVPEDVPAVRAALERAAGGASQTFEARVRRGDQQIATLLVNSRAMADGEGTVSFARDVTDLKQAQQALSRTEELFRQAQKMEAVGRLAGGIAHDFNNMLTVIRGRAEFALETLSDGHPAHEDLEEIFSASTRAAKLTRQLLTFSRRQTVELTALDLNIVITEMSKMLTRLLGEDVALKLELTPGLGAVLADAGHLEQAVVNLAVNARDAMPGGGRLTISTADVVLDEAAAARLPGATAGRHVRLRVADTGVGMTAEVRSHLFEPFFTTKAVGRGTGLGLASIYGIVKQFKGAITVASEEGKGATFDLYLPVTTDTHATESGVKALPRRRGHETVLLVEDQREVRSTVARMLRAMGYLVLEASGPDEALRQYEASADSIDLVLTDVVMPDKSGVELARALHARGRPPRVLYMTGYTDEVTGGVLGPADQVLQKPFTSERLSSAVREALDHGRAVSA